MTKPGTDTNLFRLWKAAVSILFALGLHACGESQPIANSQPDLILRNGAIYTVDASRSWAQAIAIADGTILAVGKNTEIDLLAGPLTEVVDLKGRMVMPGIVDTHTHTIEAGVINQKCRLPGTFTNPGLDTFVAALRDCDVRFADDDILRGLQFTVTAIPGDKFNRQFLDSIISDRPVFLADESGHVKWLNSKALELAGITRDTESPEGGTVVKDEQGEPTGVLLSRAGGLASALRSDDEDPELEVRGLEWAFGRMSELGVTSVMDAIVRPDDLPVWRDSIARVGVAQHINLCLWGAGSDDFNDPEVLKSAFAEVGLPEGVRMCVKLYPDGTHEAGTAALLEPYADRPGSGELNISPAALKRMVAAYDAAGIQIKTHNLGDRAVRVTLDAYEEVIQNRGNNALRHHITHNTTVHPDDIPRFRELNVGADMIGAIAALIPYVKTSYYDTLGHDRFHERVLPAGGFVRAGVVTSANSDWGAGILDPMRSIQTVITRRDPNNPDAPVAGPQHRVDLPTAIEMHTINGAWILGREEHTGSLEVGKDADLIVLDRNLFEIPAEDIRTVKVLLTLYRGKIAWKSDKSGY